MDLETRVLHLENEMKIRRNEDKIKSGEPATGDNRYAFVILDREERCGYSLIEVASGRRARFGNFLLACEAVKWAEENGYIVSTARPEDNPGDCYGHRQPRRLS